MDKDAAINVRHILEAIANIEADIAGYDFERFRVDRRDAANAAQYFISLNRDLCLGK